MRLALATSLEHALLDAFTGAGPDECCGLIVGDGKQFGDALLPLKNVARDRSVSFAFDDHEHLMTRRAVVERGHSVVAMYHSHPRSPPSPSALDTRALHIDGRALFPGECVVIVGRERAGALPVVRAFRFDEARKHLVACEITWLTSGGHRGRPRTP